jgi:hypothetical protein
MARFRRIARGFRGFKRAARRANRTTGSLKVTDVLIAGVIYGVGRPMLANVLPNFFSMGPVDSDNVIIGAAGFYGMKKGKGITKALGIMALGGEAASVTSKLMGNTGSTTSIHTNETNMAIW